MSMLARMRQFVPRAKRQLCASLPIFVLLGALIALLSRGRTLIVIAHHLGAIAEAQRIIVLDKGSVEAVGRHARLLEQSPTYKNLWEAHRNSLAWSLA